MKTHAYFGMILGCLLSVTACGHSFKNVAPAVVRLAAEDCVEIARLHGNQSVETICATAEELSPLLDMILARRNEAAKKAAFDGGVD